MRIEENHPQLLGVERGPPTRIILDGQEIDAFLGETVATVLQANGRFPTSRRHAGQPGLGGYYCGIGVCYGCQVLVDGRRQRACATDIAPQMVIATDLAGER